MTYRNLVSGAYEPSFFIIRLDSEAPVESIALESTSTFTHEYIHFLQDLTLPYCIRENLAKLNKFFAEIEQIRNSKEAHLPSRLVDADVEITSSQTELTWGDGQHQSDVGTIIFITPEHKIFNGHTGPFNVYTYRIETQHGSTCHFGAWHLLEYIAYKIESKHYPSDDSLPDLPYRSVDLVLEHYELAHLSELKRVALAEYCLLNDNPAHRLLVVVEALRTTHSDLSKTSDDNFVKALLAADWQAAGMPPETIPQKMERRLTQLRTQLLIRFPEESFPAIYHWLDEVIEYTTKQLAGRFLFADLYGMDTNQFLLRMTVITHTVGIPLIINSMNEIGTTLGGDDNKDQFIQLLLAFEVGTYLQDANPTCPMCSVCEQSAQQLINSDCFEAPFRRARSAQLCPFGAFAKTHGLADVKWYIERKRVPWRDASPFD